MRLNGNATLAVTGKVLFESQSGMDMGGQPNVNTLYTTKLQIKNGVPVFYSDNTLSVTEFEAAPPPTITSIPVSAVRNSYITVLGTGLLGATGAKLNGVSVYAFSASATEVQVLVQSNATSGPVTIETHHGTAVSSTSLTILADSDGDGMSDDFEQQYFGSFHGGDPSADSDGDGASNVNEFRTGTSPVDGNSKLRVTQIRRQGNDIVVVFPSAADKRYRLEASTSPSGPFSIDVATLAAPTVNAAREVIDVNATANVKRFYRVVLLP